jgi:uncharacterized protein YfeS
VEIANGAGAIKLTITMDQATGQIKVDGPIDNAILAFGLLEIARQAVQSHHAQKASQQRIIPMTAALPRM